MGWSSGVDVFNHIMDTVLNDDEPLTQRGVVKAVVEALEANDWDTHGDSEYSVHPVVKDVFKELNPDWDWDED